MIYEMIAFYVTGMLVGMAVMIIFNMYISKEVSFKSELLELKIVTNRQQKMIETLNSLLIDCRNELE